MGKKKEKVEKGFIDYPGKLFLIMDSAREPLLELMRRAIMHAGGADFGKLIMRNAMVAQKGAEQLLFVEVAQRPIPGAQADWIVLSIPLQHVASFVGKHTFTTSGDGTVRHYRAAKKYAIRLSAG